MFVGTRKIFEDFCTVNGLSYDQRCALEKFIGNVQSDAYDNGQEDYAEENRQNRKINFD